VQVFVLVRAPLAGQTTWSFVADELRSRGLLAVKPDLPDAREVGPPYWPHYGAAVGRQLIDLPEKASLVLVGHSGAGLMLPLVRQATMNRKVDRYVFVDAIVPEDGVIPDVDDYFAGIAKDGLIPPFSDAALRAMGLAENAVRQRLLAELRPLPFAVYQEPVPVFAGWPDAPCGYVRFKQTLAAAYQPYVDRALREGWAFRELDGGHFHMLVDPAAVAETLIDLAR
jgi:hypothetical protein